jgi:broad-specificity NMP kinase
LIEHQKSVLRMNLIKEAFRKLEEVLINLKNRGTLTPKFLRAVENIKAYKCQLVNIEIVENFPNLIEINISDNREIKSLKGL